MGVNVGCFILLLFLRVYMHLTSSLIVYLLDNFFELLLVLFWLYPNLKEDKLPHIPLLAYWGKNSLQIYLWHVFLIVIVKNLFEDSSILYYGGTLLLLGFFIFYTNHIIHKNVNNEIS